MGSSGSGQLAVAVVAAAAAANNTSKQEAKRRGRLTHLRGCCCQMSAMMPLSLPARGLGGGSVRGPWKPLAGLGLGRQGDEWQEPSAGTTHGCEAGRRVAWGRQFCKVADVC